MRSMSTACTTSGQFIDKKRHYLGVLRRSDPDSWYGSSKNSAPAPRTARRPAHRWDGRGVEGGEDQALSAA
jgi:hypothetical protein